VILIISPMYYARLCWLEPPHTCPRNFFLSISATDFCIIFRMLFVVTEMTIISNCSGEKVWIINSRLTGNSHCLSGIGPFSLDPISAWINCANGAISNCVCVFSKIEIYCFLLSTRITVQG